ncbi:hypothetical protein [Halorussus salinisoli]|uniref:hypothetical protein n=1 Tax=Halorussus salinisoli TaxID=2558242 RepID=UPI0010C1BF3A|nr:hypothetical protein [Halorussus salinisoli]
MIVVGRTGSHRSATAWLAEIGPDGTAQWTKTVDTPGFTRAVDAVPSNNGYTVLGTTDESPRLWLLHLDEDGQEQWRWRAEAPYGIRALYPADDGYLIYGYRGDPRRVDADLRAWVRAVDAEGNTRWERTYDGNYVGDLFPREAGFLLAGGSDDDAWLCAIDPDGTPAWRHTYGGVGSEGVNVAIPSTNGVLYGGSTGSIPDVHSRGMLVRTTADGEFVWRRTYDLQHIVDLTTYRNGFALTGEPQNQDHSGRDPEKPIHIVDRWGQVQKTVTVSINVGTPVGLSRFEDGALVVGGWSGEEGIWLAKIEPEAKT